MIDKSTYRVKGSGAGHNLILKPSGKRTVQNILKNSGKGFVQISVTEGSRAVACSSAQCQRRVPEGPGDGVGIRLRVNRSQCVLKAAFRLARKGKPSQWF